MTVSPSTCFYVGGWEDERRERTLSGPTYIPHRVPGDIVPPFIQDGDNTLLLVTGERHADLQHRVEEILADILPANHGECLEMGFQVVLCRRFGCFDFRVLVNAS